MQKEDENVEIQVWNNSEHCNIFAKLVIMNKKPSINSDLKGVLDLFSYTLHCPTLSMRSMNFAEMALIIHQCTLLYAKKVDLLCEIIKYNLLTLQKCTNARIKSIEEQPPAIIEDKLKRCHKKKVKEKEPGTSSNVVIRTVLNSDNDPIENRNLENTWNSISRMIALPTDDIFRQKSEIDMRQQINENIFLNKNILCNYEDLQMNTAIQSYNYSITQFEKEYLGKSNTSLDKDILLQQYVTENETNILKLHKNNLLDNFRQFSAERNLEVVQKESLYERCKRLCPRKPSINLSRLPNDTIKPYLEKYRYSLDSWKVESRKDSGCFEMSDIKNNLSLDDQSSYNDISLDSFNQGIELVVASTPKRRKVTDSEEKQPRKRRKLSQNSSIGPNLTVSLDKFESFCGSIFNVNGQEEDFPGFSTEEQTAVHERTTLYSSLVPVTEDEDQENSVFRDENEIMNESDTMIAETLTSTHFTQIDAELDVSTNLTIQNSQRTENNVREWTEFVNNKIDKESQVFNMYGYGTNILDSLSDDATPTKFASVVQEKSSSEIARYFVATLQLANTSNIELLLTKKGILNHDLQLKLLNKERPNENLQNEDTKEVILNRSKRCSQSFNSGRYFKKRPCLNVDI